MSIVPSGTWVEVEKQVRQPGRGEATPGSVQIMRVSGFLLEPAELGQPARIRTICGDHHRGRLRIQNPGYGSSFCNTFRKKQPPRIGLAALAPEPSGEEAQPASCPRAAHRKKLEVLIEQVQRHRDWGSIRLSRAMHLAGEPMNAGSVQSYLSRMGWGSQGERLSNPCPPQLGRLFR